MARPKASAPLASPDEIEQQFYEALQRGDIDGLMAVWSDDEDISCVHPGGPRVVGAGAIRAAFESIFANGAINAVGQYWWTRSLHMAPTSSVAPFIYFMLVWAMGIAFVVWGDVPTAGLIVGSAIVVGSGLFLLLRETRRSKAS